MTPLQIHALAAGTVRKCLSEERDTYNEPSHIQIHRNRQKDMSLTITTSVLLSYLQPQS